MKQTLLLLHFIAIGLTTFSQSYKFHIYNEQDGLENRYINTINQTADGRLVLGTGEGLFTFDGFNFQSYHTSDSLSEELVESSYLDKDGTLWLGHGNGTATTFKNGKCHPLDLSKYLKSKIVEIQKDKKNNLWLASQTSGIVQIENSGKRSHFTKGLEDYTIFCFYIDNNNVFWIGTDLGILRAEINGTNSFSSEIVGDLPFSAVVDIIPFEKNFVVATEDAGVFHCTIQKDNFTSKSVNFKNNPIDQFQIKSIRLDQANTLWVSTNHSGLIAYSGNSIFNFETIQAFNESGTQASKNIKSSFHDLEGNLWIGTIGNGLYKLEESYFANYFSEDTKSGAYSFINFGDTLWSTGFGTISVSINHPGNIIQQFGAASNLPADELTALYKDDNGNLWVGTSSSGCYLMKPKAKKFIRISLTQEFETCTITAISGDDEYIYIATNYGVFYLKDEKIFYHSTIETGLSGNVIKSLFKDSQNRIWIGTTTQEIPYIKSGVIEYYEPKYSNIQLTIKSFAEDKNKNIWIGTDGNGVVCLTCDEVIVFSKKEGLYSDYCYGVSILDNELWVEHRAGISKIDLKTNLVRVYQPESSKTLSFQDNAIISINSDIVYFGTNSGILRYDKSKDVKNTFEPILSFDKIIISDFVFQNPNEINLKYGDYKIEVSFRGVSLNDPSGVTYQYLLEGYDNEWSDISTINIAKYNHLPPGNYVFQVKSFNSDGAGGTKISSFKLVIAIPFWKEWWFYFVSILLFVIIFKWILNRREKIFKENQAKLKKALDERTKEVVDQKELLEEKNKDITDSIVYAKNIQNAMLPHRDMLPRLFKDAFVYFKPRDIVSGDFYWVAKFNTKTIVACADCTGHGVPGAFMSLIGSSILKDVLITPDIDSPEKVLSHLEKELHKLLNKNTSGDTIKDGMDISVVEFDESNYKLKISSANRPVFIKIGNDFIEDRGDRKSIGDSRISSAQSFTVREYQLSVGDRFYLFSDGMTDQFGGPLGKKVKRSGLNAHLRSSADQSLEVQRERLVQFINAWKGDNAQLDDMILIACEV